MRETIKLKKYIFLIDDAAIYECFPKLLGNGNAPWLDTVEYPPMLTIEYNF